MTFSVALGAILLLRETEFEDNAFGGDKQRALWYVTVFSVVVNWDRRS